MSGLLATFADISTGAVAVVGARIAWLGLSTWKNQINWQIDHDLARRFLIEIYKYRDAVNAARRPTIPSFEMELVSDEFYSQGHSALDVEIRRQKALKRRFEEIGDSGPILYALALEAKAIWGEKISEKWAVVNRLQNELSSATYRYLEKSFQAARAEDSKVTENRMQPDDPDRLIALSINEEDGRNDFSNRFSAAFSELERFLETKVGRSAT